MRHPLLWPARALQLGQQTHRRHLQYGQTHSFQNVKMIFGDCFRKCMRCVQDSTRRGQKELWEARSHMFRRCRESVPPKLGTEYQKVWKMSEMSFFSTNRFLVQEELDPGYLGSLHANQVMIGMNSCRHNSLAQPSNICLPSLLNPSKTSNPAFSLPAAQPMETKSRWSASLRKYPPYFFGALTLYFPLHQSVRALDPIPPKPPPMIAPEWTNGPIFPARIPPDIENVTAVSLHTSVLMLSRPATVDQISVVIFTLPYNWDISVIWAGFQWISSILEVSGSYLQKFCQSCLRCAPIRPLSFWLKDALRIKSMTALDHAFLEMSALGRLGLSQRIKSLMVYKLPLMWIPLR